MRVIIVRGRLDRTPEAVVIVNNDDADYAMRELSRVIKDPGYFDVQNIAPVTLGQAVAHMEEE
jgi:hypothetical protein